MWHICVVDDTLNSQNYRINNCNGLFGTAVDLYQYFSTDYDQNSSYIKMDTPDRPLNLFHGCVTKLNCDVELFISEVKSIARIRNLATNKFADPNNILKFLPQKNLSFFLETTNF